MDEEVLLNRNIKYGPEMVQKGLNNLKLNIDKKGLKQ